MSIRIQLLKLKLRLVHFLYGFITQHKPMLFTGKDASIQLCENISHFGHKRVLIVTDAILVELGILDKIKQSLKDNGIEVFIYDGVLPNPTYAMVEEGVLIFNANNCDTILAVGGGSPIDTAKAIILAECNPEKKAIELAGGYKSKRRPKPIFAIPTTAGTGSEVTLAAVISHPETHEKMPLADHRTLPLATAIDAELMQGMPPHVTAATGIDALTHAVESYISTGTNKFADQYSRAAIKMIFEFLPRAYKDGSDLKAREAMGFAAFYAGYAFTQTLLGYVHGIAHQFGGLYGTPHGFANALVLPHILDYSIVEAGPQFAELAIVCGMGKEGEPEGELARTFVDRVYALRREVGIPDTLEALQEKDIEKIAKAALKEAHTAYLVPRFMDKKTCEGIIRKLLPQEENTTSETAKQKTAEIA
ncbi:MAG: iron-containing alcohol dehydrogenase [Pseudomonadales bacterium]|nr:iron-containing alcohol dehydrogenase [Pseudomonadales bacterium]